MRNRHFLGTNRPVIGVSMLAVVGLIAVAWLVTNPVRGGPDRLADRVEKRMGNVQTVQGRLEVAMESVVLEQELWSQRPGYFRTETEQGPGAFAGTIVVLNEEEGWVYSPALRMATVVDRTAGGQALDEEAGVGSMLERVPDNVVRALTADYPVSSGETIQIAGRPATQFDMIVPDDSTLFPPGPLRIWLDDQFGYPLAWHDSTGRRIQFKSIRFNAPIDPVTFEFVPPPGAAVRRINPD